MGLGPPLEEEEEEEEEEQQQRVQVLLPRLHVVN
jgi:hypothetical protein